MSSFRVGADTNVLVSAHLSNNPASPGQEFLLRWRDGEFIFLFSWTSLIEYERKLIEKGIDRDKAVRFLALIISLGEEIEIKHFHFRVYPDDPDDIAFLLCAINGKASHLVTHDQHLLKISVSYQRFVTICRVIPFLEAVRLSE